MTPAAPTVTIRKNPAGPGWRLEASVWIPRPQDEVFAFFSDADRLQAITPAWLHFEILTPSPIQITTGTLIDYRIRLHRIPLRWRTEITLWDPPHRFIDEQRRGPYRLWRHEHILHPENGGTLNRDVVTYDVPGGLLVHQLFVARDLRRIFEFREQRLRELLGQPA